MLINVLIEGYRTTILTYSSELPLELGEVVCVSVRNKPRLGIVWEIIEKTDLPYILPVNSKAGYKLPNNFLLWLQKVAEYNCLGLSEVVGMSLISANENGDIAPYYCVEEKVLSISYLLDRIGKRKFNKLLSQGLAVPTGFSYDFKSHLNKAQQIAWDSINSAGFSKPLVIQGKTGSGKTALYFHIIDSVLRDGKKALILLPEISLTSTFADKVCDQFGFAPHIWNSKISSVAKSAIWSWAMSSGPGILIGSRSALWLPFADLGVIVVDEEHDTSYKQESTPRYHARDMSVLRRKYDDCAVVLVSATPSLETWFNVRKGKYNLVSLEGDQPISAKIVQRKKDEWLTDELKQEIQTELNKGNQCMLFLNKKGLSRVVYCSICEETLMCKYCSSNLVLYHNFVVGCSYCGKKNYLQPCYKCGNMSWQTYGLGIEKIEEEAKAVFPNATVGKFSGDIQKLHNSIEDIYSGKINLIISTQVLSKGYNFLKLTLVGIIQGEQGLSSSDPRNTEKIYQLLTQVRGRCGRDKNLDSRVIIQSSSSDNQLLEYVLKNDFPKWADEELVFRAEGKLPPQHKLIRIIISNPRSVSAEADANFVYSLLKKVDNCTVFEAVPNQLHKYKSHFYYSIILLYHHTYYPQPKIMEALSKCKLPKHSRLNIDVDPQQFI